MEFTKILFRNEVSELAAEFKVTHEEKGGAMLPEVLAVVNAIVL
jgi:hypothetical protein